MPHPPHYKMPTFRWHLVFLDRNHRRGLAVHQQADTGHPQIRQGKYGVQMLGVLTPLAANFDVTKLAFDHSK